MLSCKHLLLIGMQGTCELARAASASIAALEVWRFGRHVALDVRVLGPGTQQARGTGEFTSCVAAASGVREGFYTFWLHAGCSSCPLLHSPLAARNF